MSAALVDLPLASSDTAEGTLPRRSRSTLPIGARFPRRVTPDPAASAGQPAATTFTVTSAPIFPVGARFPRRTAAEILAYLDEMELRGASVVPTRPVYPVGARFPLH